MSVLPGFSLAQKGSQANGVVTEPTEASLCSALAGGGTVTFKVDGKITLTTTVVITSNTALDGTGHSVCLSGGGTIPVLVVQGGAALSLKRLTIADGYSLNSPGAGIVNSGTLTVSDCTFSNNVATANGLTPGGGGAIRHRGPSLILNRTTFVRNSSSLPGGAISAGGYDYPGNAGPMFVTNCTFYANDSDAVSAIGAFSQPPQFVNCTFAASTNGGIIYSEGYTPGPLPQVRNCIFAASGANGVADAGHNICSDGGAVFTNATSLRNTSPRLGAFGDYGGGTWTLPLLPGSPAVDALEPQAAPDLDQRGVLRPTGLRADTGAFEGTVDPAFPSSVRFGLASYSAVENAGPAPIRIERMGTSDGSISVGFATGSGSALPGVDFIPTNANLTFASGEMQKTAYVTIIDDSSPEPNKTVELTLHDPAGTVLDTPNTAVLTLVDNDVAQPIASLTDAALRSAVTAGGWFQFTNDGTITLTNTLEVTLPVVLDATSRKVTIAGNSNVRLFYIRPQGELDLRNLTLSDGRVAGAAGYSGVQPESARGAAALVDEGTLSLSGCLVVSNHVIGGAGEPSQGFVPATAGGTALGGAVYVFKGTFNATNTQFLANSATGGEGGGGALDAPGGWAAGGAVFNDTGLVSLESCSWNTNQVIGGRSGSTFSSYGHSGSGNASGAAIHQAGGTVQVVSGEFNGNSGTSTPPQYGSGGTVQGGAICNSNGLLIIQHALFTGNVAAGGIGRWAGDGKGGAVANFDRMQILQSLFRSNRASAGGGTYSGSGWGGAIFNLGNCQLTNDTLAGNVAAGVYGFTPPQSYGGAIRSEGAAVTVAVNSTVISNTAVYGGGLSGTVALLNTILAFNVKGTNADTPPTDLGHNISSDSSCSFSAPGSLNNTDPKLGPFGDYGGNTFTFPVLAGSPALDSGALNGAPAVDQRGHARPYGPAPDIGSFESSPPFTIVGRVRGFALSDPVNVSAGELNTTTDNLGAYRLVGFPVGQFSVSPAHPAYRFLPSSQLVTTGPDLFDINFEAFRWDTLTPKGLTNGFFHLILAPTLGSRCRIWATPDLVNWQPVATNSLTADGVFDCFVPENSASTRFYRTEIIP